MVDEITPEVNAVMKAAKEYGTEAGLWMCPIREGTKAPSGEDWNTKDNCFSRKIPPALQGIGLVHLFSGTVSIDIDDKRKAKAYFDKKGIDISKHFNAKDAVRITSGDPNRGKLIYRLPDEVDVKEFHWINDQTNGYEFRGVTKKGTAIQDVLPPSLHPSGRKYAWAGDGSWEKIPLLPEEIQELWLGQLREKASNASPPSDFDSAIMLPVITSALYSIDPDTDYKEWLEIGMGLASADLGDLWDTWSSDGASYIPGGCSARLDGFSPDGGVTIGTVFHHAKEAGWKPYNAWEAAVQHLADNPDGLGREALAENLAALIRYCGMDKGSMENAAGRIAKGLGEAKGSFILTTQSKMSTSGAKTDMTHGQIRDDYLKKLGEHVNCEGALWTYQGDYWHPISGNQISDEISRQYADQKLCQTAGSYVGITKLVLSRNENDTFFKDAPVGIACASGFYEFREDGLLSIVPNHSDQLQRHFYDVVPEAGPTPLFDQLLSAVSPSDRELLQQFAGVALLGLAPKYQKAMLLQGEAGSGKSTFVKLLELFMAQTSSVSPDKFGGDGSNLNILAQLPGSLLNTYPELPDAKHIDSPELKMLIAGERIQAKHLYRDTFFFYPTAAHMYACNKLPSIRVDEEAFWRRWLVTTWTKQNVESIRDLEKLIFDQELPQVLQWCIDGAVRVLKNNGYEEGESATGALALWRERHDIILRSKIDGEVFYEDSESRVGIAEMARNIHRWCLDEGYKQHTPRSIRADIKRRYKIVRDNGTKVVGVKLKFPNE